MSDHSTCPTGLTGPTAPAGPNVETGTGPSSLVVLTEPGCRDWARLVRAGAAGTLAGHPMSAWREKTRRELGLATDRPIIATGHQTLLWHPGILVKYMLTDAVAAAEGLATANLIVDQHAGGFGDFEVPVRRPDDTLAVRRIELTRPRPDVPMALHPPFVPAATALPGTPALPSVAEGVASIRGAIETHRDAPNAALQMGAALADLMRRWARPSPQVTTTDLVETSVAKAILREMTRDPRGCAAAYNASVASLPEAGIGPLLVRDDYVEMPLWRIRPDGRRMRAYDNDVEAALAGDAEAPRLMPRALFMTALVRLGMCDLFVHGTGGANYDRAMVRWIRDWLGVEPAPIAVATATLRLPLLVAPEAAADPVAVAAAARRAWHDPEPEDGGRPGPVKRTFLDVVERAPAGSARRREAFDALHRELAVLRGVHAGRVERLQRDAATARRRQADALIADRRDWPFPLYPQEMLDALRREAALAAGAVKE